MEERSGKKVIFYSPYPFSPYWETELELIEKYQQQGGEVILLYCKENFPSCMVNPFHKKGICLTCRSTKASGVKWLRKENLTVKPFYDVNEEQQEVIQQISSLKLTSIEQISNIKIDDVEIGVGALSSVASLLRDPSPDIEKNSYLLSRFLTSAAMVYFSLLNHISREKPDDFVAFNGRFGEIRPAVRVAMKFGVNTYLHEVAGVIGRYALIKNDFMHSLDVIKRELYTTNEDSPLLSEDKLKIAKSWFEERRAAKVTRQISMTENQIAGLLPEEINSQKVNVAVFCSSDFEYIGFEGYDNLIYKDQSDALIKILESFDLTPNIKFYIRSHPYLSGFDNSQTRFESGLDKRFNNVEVIPPESPVSSYSLLDACDLIITFGSTVGIEAVYAGKPSISLGRSLYEDFDAVIKPKNHQELVSIIENYLNDKSLPASGNAEEAIEKYGFFMKMSGLPLQYVKMPTYDDIKMIRDDQEYTVKPSITSRAISKFLSVLDRDKPVN